MILAFASAISPTTGCLLNRHRHAPMCGSDDPLVEVNFSTLPADSVPMDTKARDGSSMQRGTVAVVIVAAFVAVGSLGALLVVTSGARTVAVTSEALEWSNAVSAASAATRAANSQALVFAVDFELGVASAEARAIAVDEARNNLVLLQDVASSPPSGAHDEGVLTTISELQAAALNTIVAIEGGDLAEADRLHSEVFGRAYRNSSAALLVQQGEFAAAVQAADSVAARFEAATQLFITLLIPIGAILVYRTVVRRQQRDRRLVFEARLSAEQEYSRSKDEFFGGMSHELRTPLTSIYGLSGHLMESGLHDPSEAEELIALIHRDSAELFRMVEDLLMAARLDAGLVDVTPTPVDIAAAFASVINPMKRTGVDVELDGSATVRGDRCLVTHIARNLLSNAHAHGGDSIRVAIREVDSAIKVEVSDNGPGVATDRVDTLFKPFVHDGAEVLLVGTFGLGLAVARLLVEAMGGTIEYRRADGWSSFVLTLESVGSRSVAIPPPMSGDPFADCPPAPISAVPSGQGMVGS